MGVIERIQNGEATAEEAREALAPLINRGGEFSLQLAYTCARDWTWKALNARRRDEADMRAWFYLLRAFADHLRRAHPEHSGRFYSLMDMVGVSISHGEVPPGKRPSAA